MSTLETNNTDAKEEGNVVSFHGDQPFPFTTAPRRGYCVAQCRRVFVIEHTRLLRCQDCEKAIDPFDYCYQWALAGDRRLGQLKALDTEIRQKGAELVRVKDEVANAKAARRRAQNHLDLAPAAFAEGAPRP